MTLQPATRVGHYEVLSSVGAGGMGEVYRASDPRLGREVAVKVITAALSQDRDAVARFEREYLHHQRPRRGGTIAYVEGSQLHVIVNWFDHLRRATASTR